MATLRDVILAMPGYDPDPAVLSHAAVLAYLEESVTVERPIDYIKFVTWASQNQGFHKIGTEMKAIEAGTSGITNGQQNDTRAVSALLLSGGNWSLDLSDPDVRSIFNSIAGGVVISNPDRAALFALSDTLVSRWETADGGATLSQIDDSSKLYHIQQARL